jgi:hypothetical protein
MCEAVERGKADSILDVAFAPQDARIINSSGETWGYSNKGT